MKQILRIMFMRNGFVRPEDKEFLAGPMHNSELLRIWHTPTTGHIAKDCKLVCTCIREMWLLRRMLKDCRL